MGGLAEVIIKFCDTTLKFIANAVSVEQHKERLRDAVELLKKAGQEISRLNELVRTYSDKIKQLEEEKNK
jgi:chromosome segregation ATPase